MLRVQALGGRLYLGAGVKCFLFIDPPIPYAAPANGALGCDDAQGPDIGCI